MNSVITGAVRTALVLLVTLFTLIACGSRPDTDATGSAPPSSAGPASRMPDPQTEAQRIEQLVGDMSLEDKVGQLFVIHAHGPAIDAVDPELAAKNEELHGVGTIAEVIRTFRPGGIVYFEWTNNIETPEQVAHLSNAIQSEALQVGAGIRLLIGIDQEHGIVRRLTEPATEFPGSMALGATYDPEDAYRAAAITAEELRVVGINVNFAPVADVNLNPNNPVIGTRSFGDQPELVGQFASAQIQGHRQGGVAAAVKHFPGHGDTDVDSHTGLPVIDHSWDVLSTVDLPPFRAAIDAGADLVMTAHIVVPALDPSLRPATLSKPILTDLLREDMGFGGVIITDALTMDAVNDGPDAGRVPVEALLAGADLLLMPASMTDAYAVVLDAVKSGELPLERIDESVRRVLRLKQKLGLFENVLVDVEHVSEVVGNDSHREAAREIARGSITLVRDDARLLPVQIENYERILVTGWGEAAVTRLSRALERKGLTVVQVVTGGNPDGAAIDSAVAVARRSDLALVLSHNVQFDQGQRSLIERLVQAGTPVIVIAVGVPYDIAHLHSVETFLAVYGYGAVTMDAVAEVLAGQSQPRGRLPVTIFDGHDNRSPILYQSGHALTSTPVAGEQ